MLVSFFAQAQDCPDFGNNSKKQKTKRVVKNPFAKKNRIKNNPQGDAFITKTNKNKKDKNADAFTKRQQRKEQKQKDSFERKQKRKNKKLGEKSNGEKPEKKKTAKKILLTESQKEKRERETESRKWVYLIKKCTNYTSKPHSSLTLLLLLFFSSGFSSFLLDSDCFGWLFFSSLYAD